MALLKIIFVNYKIKVQVIRMGNAGENIYIEKAIRSDPVLSEMGTVIEYTAPYTPQQNGKVEQAFPTLFSRARASCKGAKLPTTLQKKLFCEAFRDTVQKDAILYTRDREAGPPYNAFFRKSAPYVEDLHSCREIGICYLPRLGYNRTSNKGRVGLYLNLPIKHPRHTLHGQASRGGSTKKLVRKIIFIKRS